MSLDTLSAAGRTLPPLRTRAWGFVTAAAAIVLLSCALSANTPSTAVAWASCALAAWCASLMTLIAAVSGRDGTGLAQWKLGSWSLAWCAVTFGLATAAWSPLQGNSGGQLTPNSILHGLWLVAVAMTVWSVGYCI